MTDDIVARLRRHAKLPSEKIDRKALFDAAKKAVKDRNADILVRLRAIVVVSGGVTNNNVDHIVKAADEIERLREENRKLRDFQFEACRWGLSLIEPIQRDTNAQHQRKEDRTNGND